MNFATTKERIIQYIDFKGIKIKDFYKKTGIKRGFLDSDKLKSSVSDVFLAIIFATFNDVNPIWLITGEGEMLKTHKHYTTEQSALSTVAEPNEGGYNKYISALEDKIKLLEENRLLSQEIKQLQERISRLELENTSIKSKPQDRAAG
ncbi:hypothetical protein EJN86_11570 [Riemerella anatipestifer]|uniref:hypothetical protein n=1 Tax=Riemerella anatipestifer TaxID=34085 RepID=UPI00137292AA|nr:hypothetical protein [Riemerella anatipestifer]MEE3725377.1 hypothetical protein [Riemerella anatipestifer]NAV17430.1 hypothetical protein [Riemerella anatipestifer]